MGYYDYCAKRIIIKTRTGGAVYQVDPTSLAATPFPTTGTAPPDAINGVHTLFQSLPKLGGYAYQPAHTAKLYFLPRNSGAQLRRAGILPKRLPVNLEHVPLRLPVEVRLRLVANHRALERRPIRGQLGPIGAVDLQLLSQRRRAHHFARAQVIDLESRLGPLQRSDIRIRNVYGVNVRTELFELAAEPPHESMTLLHLIGRRPPRRDAGQAKRSHREPVQVGHHLRVLLVGELAHRVRLSRVDRVLLVHR